MPEIINTIFGRTNNDTTQSDSADVAVTDETGDIKAIEVAPTETSMVEPTADATATEDATEDVAESAETAPSADGVVESTEVADEDGGSAADIEPVAAETAADVDQTEPVVEPVTAETRPAAGTRGGFTVGDGVVAKVVTIVVGKLDGVHSLDDEGISVEVDDDIATIRVSLVVEYGHAVKALAEQIRIDVIEAVEQFLGLDVAAVDVHVSDIHAPVIS